MYHVERERVLVCMHTHKQHFPDGARKHVQLPAFPFCSMTVGCTYPEFAVQGLRALLLFLSGIEQKKLCSWIWVWVRGRACVCIWEVLMVCSMWLHHWLLFRRVHGVQGGVSVSQRKLSVMLICNGLTRMGCAAEVNAPKYYFTSQL